MNTSAWLSIVALFVTAASAIVSLVKEHQERRERNEQNTRQWHWHVRLGLTLLGFFTGVILIVLSARSSKASEDKHVQERAADKQQIAGLSQAVETQIQNNETQYLRHQKELGSLRDQVTDLKKDIATEDLRKKIESLEGRLDKSLAPRPLAKLQSSFWRADLRNEPIREIYAPVDENVVTFDFTLINYSEVSAGDITLWLRICKDCKYHKEPEGSRLVPGAEPTERLFPNLNLPAGVRWQKLTVEMEIPPNTNRIEVGTRYRCSDCLIEKDYQILAVTPGWLPLPMLAPPQQPKKATKKPT
jgi:hypothetical protein